MRRFIIFNGPPRSGKDTAADAVVSSLGACKIGMADALKRATHATYGLPADTAIDAFEKVKDEPRPEFFGLTPRQAYIAHSENYMKPLHGDQVFGRLYMREVEKCAGRHAYIVNPNGGFAAENAPIIAEAGRKNVLLIRVHREGKTFEGDSRSYIELPGVLALDIHNNGSQRQFCVDVVTLVRDWTWV